MRTYRASELGSCIRAQAATQLGYSPLPTPAWLQSAYDRGIAHEAECVEAMRADGWLIDREQHLVTMPISDDVRIEGHLDGTCNEVVRHTVKDRVLEVKSPGAWAKFRDAHLRACWDDPLAHRYAWQISVYMLTMGMEAVIACVEEGQVRTFGIEVAPFDWTAIKERVDEIERWVGTGGIPPTCSQDDGQGCPVAYLHAAQEERVVLDNPALAGWLHRHLAAQAEAALLSEERKQFELPPGRYECDSVHVTVAVTKGRTTYDTKAAMAAGVDLEPYKKVGKPGVRWDVE